MVEHAEQNLRPAQRSLPAASVAVQRLVDQLTALQPLEQHAPEVTALLRLAPLTARNLAPYQAWLPRQYTRNLVYRNAFFELLCVCWEPGSLSPIHDHGGQLCWLQVLQGSLRAQAYALKDRGQRGHSGPQVAVQACGGPTELQLLDIEHDGTDSDIHQLFNLEGLQQRAISLHIYARPIDMAVTYCRRTGSARHVAMGYHGRGPHQ
jgi:cysteine dioxygenase